MVFAVGTGSEKFNVNYVERIIAKIDVRRSISGATTSNNCIAMG